MEKKKPPVCLFLIYNSQKKTNKAVLVRRCRNEDLVRCELTLPSQGQPGDMEQNGNTLGCSDPTPRYLQTTRKKCIPNHSHHIMI